MSLFSMSWNVLILKNVKGWNVLGYLGVENNENESWIDVSWIFHVKGWSVCGLKCQWV